MIKSVKKIVAVAACGAFAFCLAGSINGTMAEAAQKPAYSDGTHNSYSHRLKEEDKNHSYAVYDIRHKYAGDEAKMGKELKKEQERHDKVVRKIKDDYNKKK